MATGSLGTGSRQLAVDLAGTWNSCQNERRCLGEPVPGTEPESPQTAWVCHWPLGGGAAPSIAIGWAPASQVASDEPQET